MKLEIAIDILEDLLDRLEGEESQALQLAIESLTDATIEREEEIEKAVKMIKEIGGWPDKNIRSIWNFIRSKMRLSEDYKQEIERRLELDGKE